MRNIRYCSVPSKHYTVLAFPITILGSSFQNEWKRYQLYRDLKRQKLMLKRKASKYPQQYHPVYTVMYKKKALVVLTTRASVLQRELQEFITGVNETIGDMVEKADEMAEILEAMQLHPSLAKQKGK